MAEALARDDRLIRAVIVDDHPLLQAGTKLCLEASGEISVVGLASRGAEVLGLVAQHQPDVLVLDLHLPDLAGMEVVRRVRAAYPAVAVLVLTGHDEAGYVRPLL